MDAPPADNKTAMNTLRAILFFLRRSILILLIVYWMGFIGFTLEKLALGGPHAVKAFYAHISGEVFSWKWRPFVAQQLTILATTVAVGFLEWWTSKRKPGKPGDGPFPKPS
jgi:hypothetical protein